MMWLGLIKIFTTISHKKDAQIYREKYYGQNVHIEMKSLGEIDFFAKKLSIVC